jgi:23S rRNA (cytidine1920-2'-O)/16S rRNA (cytidine1409-2'-O)-methyltransferase
MRADLFLHKAGLARSRSHAASLIRGGVTICGKLIKKPSEDVAEDTPISAVHIQTPSKYVSRGGIKLEGALEIFAPEIKGKTALDLGASTGGFTDCLLQNGASRVYAVDVGHGQLDPTLANDPRVISMEGTNARTLTPEMLGETCDLAVSDLSFISQALIYHTVTLTVKKGGEFISLIKPQFEAGKEALNKNGIVKDRKTHVAVIRKLFEEAEAIGLYPEALAPSPIEGGDGNREYLALFRIGEKRETAPIDIAKVVFDTPKGE